MLTLEIVEQRGVGRLGSGGGGSASFNQPWREMTPGSGSGHGGSSGRRGGREPPEKWLTLFALRLAVHEKAASGLGKLDFAWVLSAFACVALSVMRLWKQDFHGHQHMELQKLAMDILTGMAMDQRANETIAGTGGVIKLLLSIFFNAQELELGREAGEALAMLALESETSCSAILKARSDVIDPLVSAVESHDARCLNAMRLLRNLCAYSGEEHRTRLSAVTTAMPAVLRATMTGHSKILEVSVGLTTQICQFMDGEQFAAELRGAGLDKRAYVQRLAGILRQYKYPEVTVPRMRRFVVQQVIWLMKSSPRRGGGGFVELLRDRELGMERLLEAIADTTSEVECYHVFSGSVPISRHRESFSAIVETALHLVAAGGGGSSEGSFG